MYTWCLKTTKISQHCFLGQKCLQVIRKLHVNVLQMQRSLKHVSCMMFGPRHNTSECVGGLIRKLKCSDYDLGYC